MEEEWKCTAIRLSHQEAHCPENCCPEERQRAGAGVGATAPDTTVVLGKEEHTTEQLHPARVGVEEETVSPGPI